MRPRPLPTHGATILSLALLSPATHAQGTVSIPRQATYEGTDSDELGSFPETRLQIVYGELRGQQHTMKRLQFRPDYREHLPALAIGRTWSNVTLDASETSAYANLSAQFAANVTGTPTRVFSGSVTWPTLSGWPGTWPALWGGLSGQIGFPFGTPFAYTGAQDLLLDFDFAGGTLNNGGAWWTGPGGSKGGGAQPIRKHYILDAEWVDTARRDGLFRPMPFPPVSPSCSDTAWVPFGEARAEAHAVALSAAPARVEFEFRTLGTAPGATVVQALGLGGLPVGIGVGAKCQRLYVDFAKPTVLRFATAGTRFGGTPWLKLTAPWSQALSRVHLFVQGAWLDSSTGAFALTSAVETVFPEAMPPATLPRQKSVFSRFTRATTAEVGPLLSAYAPYVRFVK